MKRIKLALALNCVVVASTIAAFVINCVSHENPLVKNGLDSLMFFTTDSNLLAGLTALVMIVFELQILRRKRDSLPHAAIVFRYVGMCSVMLTFTVVMVLLVWLYGVKFTLLGTAFYNHVAGPLIALFVFAFLEIDSKISLRESFLTFLPCLLYGIVYFTEVVIIGAENGGWMDFYAFNTGGLWYIISVVVFGVMFGVATLTRLLHNKFVDKQRGVDMREEPMCGGTTRNVDENAPKEIKSDKMTFFKAESSFVSVIKETDDLKLDFISAYAVKLGKGVFLLLEYCLTFEDTVCVWNYVADDIFPTLVKLTADEKLARNNGVYSRTHGLPQNFGGEVRIEYESGEVISYSDNQSSVFSRKFAAAIYKLFNEKMQSERLSIPDEQRIVGVKFLEERKDGYTRAELRSSGEGWKIDSESNYGAPETYKKTKSVSADLISQFRETVKKNAMLMWNSFPESGYKQLSRKTLTFVFDDGNELTVSNDRALPSQFSRAFFNIELELTK